MHRPIFPKVITTYLPPILYFHLWRVNKCPTAPNHNEIISQFGVKPDNLIVGYAMTEKNPMPVNHKGKYISFPWKIPILLD